VARRTITVWECSRCGVQQEAGPAIADWRSTSRPKPVNSTKRVARIDLCADCVETFWAWMEGRAVEYDRHVSDRNVKPATESDAPETQP